MGRVSICIGIMVIVLEVGRVTIYRCVGMYMGGSDVNRYIVNLTSRSVL